MEKSAIVTLVRAAPLSRMKEPRSAQVDLLKEDISLPNGRGLTLTSKFLVLPELVTFSLLMSLEGTLFA